MGSPTGFAGPYILCVLVWYNVRLVVIVVCCDYRSVQIVLHVGDDRLEDRRVTQAQGVIL